MDNPQVQGQARYHYFDPNICHVTRIDQSEAEFGAI